MATFELHKADLDAVVETLQQAYGVTLLGHEDRVRSLSADFAAARLAAEQSDKMRRLIASAIPALCDFAADMEAQEGLSELRELIDHCRAAVWPNTEVER